MPLPLIARAFGIAAHEPWKHRDLARALAAGGEEEPRAIVCDAKDPSVRETVVMARATARSHTGRLVQKAAELIAERPGGGLL
jgi:hypothetical protein